MAPSLAGKNFDLSKIRSLNKNAGPGPGRPRTTPIDPNWTDLKAIESYIYDTIPADHDSDKLEQLIANVRGARADGNTAEYAQALKELLAFHYDSFDSANAYKSPLDLVKGDRFMSPREVAMVAGSLHNKDRAGTQPKSYEDLRKELADQIRTTLPRISSILNTLGDDWKAEGALEIIDRYKSEFEAAYLSQGISGSEASFRAQSKTLAKTRQMLSSPESAHIRLSSQAANAEIMLYMDTDLPDGSPFTPVASDAEVAAMLGGIRKARINKFNKDKIVLHAMASKTSLPKSVASQITENDAAFTVHGADGVFIYPKRVSAIANDLSFNPDWYSTDVKSLDAAFQHIIVHETGHLMMYKHWGSEKDNGRASLISDMSKFKVPKGVSQYGDQSPSENFAEQYAKYLLTGDASPEFLALLESKGLTKAQINTKWRAQYASASHSKFFDFLDKIWADDAAQYIPEYDGPERHEYTKMGKYGASKVHKLARFFGFTSSKPTLVDSVDLDDKWTIFRAVDSIPRDGRTVSAKELHEEFRDKDIPWWGYGIYGDGQYFAHEESTTYSFGSAALAVSLDPNAPVYVYSGRSHGGTVGLYGTPATANGGHDVQKFTRELENTLLREIVLNEVNPDATDAEIRAEIRILQSKLGLTGDSEHDASILAGIFGFKGIEVLNGNGHDHSFFVVLDRSMLKMPKNITQDMIGTSSRRLTYGKKRRKLV